MDFNVLVLNKLILMDQNVSFAQITVINVEIMVVVSV